MTENEQYVADAIEQHIRAGFYNQSDIERMIDDIAEDDCDIAELKASVGPALRAKLRAERSWPAVTDCDRLDKVFYDLHEAGICALSNTGTTMSDGYSDVTEALAHAPAEHYRGYCFYHGQDVESALDGHGVWIAFGALDPLPARAVEAGEVVAAALRDAGLTIAWDETAATRIHILPFNWQKRAING